jgi:hypothetical protein
MALERVQDAHRGPSIAEAEDQVAGGIERQNASLAGGHRVEKLLA